MGIMFAKKQMRLLSLASRLTPDETSSEDAGRSRQFPSLANRS